jgi:signal transduction histidine kinase
MATTVASSSHTKSARLDPVLLVPAIVAAGLAVGWLGADRGVSGTRIATDLALSWTLVAASVVALERTRWRRSRILLAAAAFALLAADLQWASSGVFWTLGFLLEAVWAALLVHIVLTFPKGRPWSRVASVTAMCAYGTAAGGQLVRAFVLPDSRDVLAITSTQRVADAVGRAQEALGILLGLTVLVLVVGRLRGLRGPAWRAQAPLLAAAAVGGSAAAVWLGWVSVTGAGFPTLERLARAVALLVPLGAVAGITWSRLSRHAASDLVVELRTGGSASLRERLARILGDPTLDVAYRLDDGRYVDADGRPRELLEGPNRAITVVTAQGREVAALVHDSALLDEPGLVESVRATAGLVLENERLAAQVRAQLAEVRASRARLVAATDAERRRLERNLHDGAQQRLVTLAVTLGLAATRGDAASAHVLSSAQDEVEEAIGELRELARGIHPTLLREEGLDAAVSALARRAPLPVATHGSAGGRLPDAVELAAYFLVSEALTNVVKHASAKEASVRVERLAGTLSVSVKDDGAGGARPTAGSGLAGMRDRLEALDASLVVESRPGHGTTVRAEIPCG